MALIITIIVLSLFAVILVSILGVGTARKIRYINFNDYHLIVVQYYGNTLATWVLARDTTVCVSINDVLSLYAGLGAGAT